MKFQWLSLKTAGLVAFFLGMPLVEKAKADSTTDIIDGSLSLVYAIIDAAGNS